ncbi:MAG TPA: hypothetical protein VG253_28195 [Streptosporangiaceae bacterium]|nr:hypothetical protein [Streptosporangiaceae bacterium]
MSTHQFSNDPATPLVDYQHRGEELAQLLADVAGAAGQDMVRDARQAGAGGGVRGKGTEPDAGC